MRRGEGAGWASLVAAVVVACAGCTTGTAATGTPGSTTTTSGRPVGGPGAAVVPGATMVVTVPDLPTAGLSSAAPPTTPVNSTPAVENTAVTSSTQRGGQTRTSTTKAATTSTAATSTSTGPARSSAVGKSAAATGIGGTRITSTSAGAPTPASTTAVKPATFTVSVAGCSTCTVLGTHAGVTMTLGAALVATGPGHAALVAVRADGSVAGVTNMLYGTTFPSPPGGEVACDSGGRCIVVAQQSDGRAIAAAYRVAADGNWTDLTGGSGFPSATDTAITLTVGGAVGFAVQDEVDGTRVWTVYGWGSDGYTVQGCSMAAVPDPTALSMTSCLS